jgi:phosphate-selective porin OprO/OprP
MRSLALGRRLPLAAASFLVTALALSGAAGAEDVGGSAATATGASDRPVVEKVLDILLQEKSITQGQYQELLDQARREQAAHSSDAAKASPTAPVAADAPGWDVSWDRGTHVDREDGAFKLKFGGLTQVDGAVIAESNGLSNDLRALGGNGQGDGVEFRRARLFFEGTVYERLFFKAMYDFASGNPQFKDVYMGLRGLGPVGSVQVGQFKEPFYLDEMTGDDYITFMERATPNVFFPDRQVGVMAMNTVADKRMLWQVATFREANQFGQAFNTFSGTNWDLASRFTGTPIYSDEGAHLLHLGVDYVHRFVGDQIRFRQRPESHLADRFVDTLNLNASGVDSFDTELAAVYGPLAFQSEYTNALVNRDQNEQNDYFWGAYGQVSYFLTGEHKVYEPDYGRFGRVKPKANFNPVKGDWGAWEVAARYSYLDLDDHAVEGGKLWDVTAGINWYLFPNARIMLNYIHADVSGREATIATVPTNVTGTGDIVQTRFQVDF